MGNGSNYRIVIDVPTIASHNKQPVAIMSSITVIGGRMTPIAGNGCICRIRQMETGGAVALIPGTTSTSQDENNGAGCNQAARGPKSFLTSAHQFRGRVTTDL